MATIEVSPEMAILYNDVKKLINGSIRKESNSSMDVEIENYTYRLFYSADPQSNKLSVHISVQGVDWGWVRGGLNNKIVFEDIISDFDSRYEIIAFKLFEWLYNKFASSKQNYSSLIDSMVKSFDLKLPTYESDVRINMLEQKIRDLEALIIKEKPKIIGLKGIM